MRACVYVRRGLTMGAAGAKNTSDVSGRCGVTKGLRGRRGIRQSLNSAFSANPRLVSVSFVSSSHSRGGRGGDRGISEARNMWREGRHALLRCSRQLSISKLVMQLKATVLSLLARGAATARPNYWAEH